MNYKYPGICTYTLSVWHRDAVSVINVEGEDHIFCEFIQKETRNSESFDMKLYCILLY